MDFARFPHIVSRILQFANDDVLVGVRPTCTALRAIADKLLVEHVVLRCEPCCLCVVTYSSPQSGRRIPCLPTEAHECSNINNLRHPKSPPPAVKHIRVLDFLNETDPARLALLRTALTNIEILRTWDDETFDLDFCPLVPSQKFIYFIGGYVSFGADNLTFDVPVAHGVKHVVVTLAFAVDGPRLQNIKHQYPNQHSVTRVTVIFRRDKGNQSTYPRVEKTSLHGLGLLKIFKQCATELGTVTYTFVGLDDYLEFCRFNPGDGPRPIAARRYAHIRGYIKSRAIKAGTFEGRFPGLRFLTQSSGGRRASVQP